MIKTYYECDACKCFSFSNDYLTTVEVKLSRFVGWRAELKPPVITLCTECLLDRCGIEIPRGGEEFRKVQVVVSEPDATERLAAALADFIQENMQS